MKKLRSIPLVLGLFIAGMLFGFSQNTPTKLQQEKLKVKKHTLMERFEPEMVIPVEDRIQLKEDRIVQLKETKELLDTLNITERKRRKLIRDLRRSPIFSNRLNKIIAENKYVEDENQ